MKSAAYPWYRTAGLFGGPALAATLLFLAPPSGISAEGWRVAAVGLLMAVWWMTEALPLAATALLPLVLFPLLGIRGLDATATAYADPLIFLFMGGFMLARAMLRWQLSQRVALHILRLGGVRPVAIVASLMAATAFLSMWISNTATAMAMLPIGQSILAAVCQSDGGQQKPENAEFGAALMLGIAYSASIGGMGTLIGTPPNALFASFMRDSHGITIGFAQWMLIGVPAVVILLPIAWLVLTRVAFRVPLSALGEERNPVMGQITALGPMSRGERMVAAVLVLVAILWISRPLLQRYLPGLELSDAGVAVTAAVLLFLLPVQRSQGVFLLAWEEAVQLPWGVMILFGGGLALAEAISASGLATWIGSSVAILGSLPTLALVLAVAILVVLLGELASNTAMAAIFLPIAAATAIGIGENPLVLALPVVMAASMGFMLPVATPPNAIVLGSGAVTTGQMLCAGIILDLVSVVVVTAVAATVGPWVLAAEWSLS